MIEKLKLIFRYIKFRISAGNAYSIHSPFVYELYSEVLQEKKIPEFTHLEEKISAIRRDLYKRKDKIYLKQKNGKVHKEKYPESGKYIRSISLSSKEGRILTRLIAKFQPEHIVEMGTGAGIGTLYLASANSSVPVYTIEGNPDIANTASEVFEKHNYDNISLNKGTFDQKLPEILKKLNHASIIFIDGDHRSEALLRYFNIIKPFLNKHSVLILHDIYWSEDMQKAWKTILSFPEISLSVDVFYFGILFFNEIPKQNFKLRI